MKANYFLLVLGMMAWSITTSHAKPNVIVILVDDMGYSDAGAFGGEVKTPNVDRLAKGGLRFTQNYNSARCCPSRASLLTGLYSHQAGIANFTGGDRSAKMGPAYRGKLNKECVTLAEVLKQAGYNTYCVGKWHVGHEESPETRGFDEFYGYTRGHSTSQWQVNNYRRLPADRKPEFSYEPDEFYATDAFSDYAVEFVKQGQRKKKPFFLYLAHSSPHFPLHAPAKTRDSYLDTYRRGWDVLRKERYERQKKSGLVTKTWKFTDLSDVPTDRPDIANGFPGKKNPTWKEVAADRREDLVYRMATFAAMVEHVDRGIGRILRQLEEGDDLENTLILFTSDNGACYEWGPYGFDGRSRTGKTTLHKGEDLDKVGGPGTHHSVGSAWSCLSNTPMRMYKHFNYEGGQCSPLVAHWPKGIKDADRWVRAPIHLIDLMPTICSATGANYPETFAGNEIQPVEGVSLQAIFEGESKLPERVLCFDHFGSSAIRRGDWKLVRSNTRYNKGAWQLYNIGQDRCETNDLMKSFPDKAEQLKKEWLDWAIRVKVAPFFQQAALKAGDALTWVRSTKAKAPRSVSGGLGVTVTFENRSGQPVRLHWIGYKGERQGYGDLAPGATSRQATYTGATWLVTDKKGKSLGYFTAGLKDAKAVIPKKK
jgi:arylsulfatase